MPAAVALSRRLLFSNEIVMSPVTYSYHFVCVWFELYFWTIKEIPEFKVQPNINKLTRLSHRIISFRESNRDRKNEK